MKKLILIIGTLVLVGLNLSSQTQDASKAFIQATASSETEIVPDEIYITITLQERMESKEKLTIEKQEEGLKNNLKEIGIDLSNLTLNTANADFRKIKLSKKDLITSKSYNLKVDNAETVSKVFERLDKINAYDAYVSKLTHSKILDYNKENRIKAIKAAKDKVDYLAAAVGNKIGSPIEIIEVENSVQNNPYNYYYGNNRSSNVSQSYNSADNFDVTTEELSFKKIKIKASFSVKYELLNK